MTNEQTASDMKATLRKFNRGVRDVRIQHGIICVFVTSKRAAKSVMTDLSLSRAFKSLTPTVNNISGGFIIHAVPK